jgi:1-acyl-sn-glycerol-3-phosphate acyltransferase
MMSKTYRFGKILLTILLKTLFRFSVFGKEHFPQGGAIIASNHSSFLDPPIVGTAAPHGISYLARDTLFKNAFANWLYTKLGAIPIKRQAADPGSIKTILSALREGRKIVMFPEGTRTRDGSLQKARRGIGYLVCKAKVPVIPTYTHGTFDALPRHRGIPHFSKIAVSFGEPVYFDDVWSGRPSKEDYDRIGEQIMARISELRESVLRQYATGRKRLKAARAGTSR